MDCFLDEDDVFFYMSTFYESSLILGYDGREQVLDTVGDDFGYDFVTNVA